MENKYTVTVTDTFAGEANFAWVRRYTVTLPANASDMALVRAAKKAAGFSGVRGRTEQEWDGFTFRPFGACVVMFCNLSR